MTSDRDRPTTLVADLYVIRVRIVADLYVIRVRIVADLYVIRVRIVAVPRSDDYPQGVKYSMHYGTLDGETILRYDNAHGRHERHCGSDRTEIDFPGYETRYRRFRSEIERL